MIYDYHIVFGVLGVAVGVVRYAVYVRDIFQGNTRPHIFSWFVWAVLNGIVFSAQVVSHAGPGAWVTGLITGACLFVAVVALFKGEKGITRSDWLCFIAALAGVGLWVLTDTPLLAVIVVTITDAIAYIPTYRKSYWKPREEHAGSYALAALRSVFAIIALDSLSITNWLHPASLIITDGGFAVMAWMRRRQLKV